MDVDIHFTCILLLVDSIQSHLAYFSGEAACSMALLSDTTFRFGELELATTSDGLHSSLANVQS